MKRNETALKGTVGKARGREGVWSHLDVSDVFKMRGSDEKHAGTLNPWWLSSKLMKEQRSQEVREAPLFEEDT